MKRESLASQALFAIGGIVFTGMLFASDGVAFQNGASWDAQTTWFGAVPTGGGCAVISNTVTSLNQNLAGLTLSRLEIHSSTGAFTLKGTEPIAFVGNATIDMPNDAVPGSRGASYMCTILPTVSVASDSLTLSGGWWYQFSSVTGEGTLRVADGALQMTNTVATLHAGDLELCGGAFHYLPKLAADKAAATQIAGTLLASQPGSTVKLTRGDGASASVTVGALDLTTTGSLMVVSANGYPGTTERFFVTDSFSVPVRSGVADARIVVADQSAATGFRMAFAKYDAADGLIPYEPTKSLAEAGENDIAVVNEATTLSADAHVRGLVIDNAAVLTVPAGITLTLGDGENAAAIIVNSQAGDSSKQSLSIAGEGTIAFGGSPAIFYLSVENQNSSLTINPAITGSNGAWFVGNASPSGFGGTISFAGNAAGWTGPTRVASCRIELSSGVASLPPAGDVYFDGGKAVSSAGLTVNGKDCTFDQHLHLKGSGAKESTIVGALGLNGADATMNGAVTLEGDASIGTDAAAVRTATYNGPIDGVGGLILESGKQSFKGTNTYHGLTRFRGTTTAIYTGGSTPGAGGFEIGDSASVTFQNSTASSTVISGDYRNAGTLLFSNGAWQLPGVGSASQIEMRSAQLAIQDLSVNKIRNPDWQRDTVKALSATGTVTFGGAEDARVAVKLRDGDGRLSLVKTGSGTLTLSGEQSYTGGTVIKEGTLRLTSGILDDARISWWLDASDASTVVTNASGMVTEWRSKVGDIVFTRAKYSTNPQPGPYYTNTINGLSVMSFDSSSHNRLCGNDTSSQRTVFIVNRPRELPQYFGLYGLYGDTGIRAESVDASGYAASWRLVSAATGIGDGNSFRVNGSGQSITNRMVNVVSFTKGYDGPANYVAYLGGYYPWYKDGSYGARNFRGEICEAIAYNRVLSEAERSEVEQYLAKKWNFELRSKSSAAEKESVLSATTEIEIAEGATLDLCGVNQTVAALRGAGTIINSSTEPAVLTVSGACDFNGKVRGSVRLVAAGGGKLALEMTGTGTLAAGGATDVSCRQFEMPTNGLALWLDASRSDTIVTNAKGRVTSWNSRAGRLEKVINNMGLTWQKWYQCGAECVGAADDGKPGVHFVSTNSLSAKNCSPRTVFFVAKMTGTQKDRAAPWGVYAQQTKICYRTDRFNITDYWSILGTVGTICVNDVETLLCKAGSRYILSLRVDDRYSSSEFGPADGSSYGYGFTIGANYNSGMDEFVHEVIVFERNVTDAEYRAIYDYLKEKWVDSPEGTVGGITTRALADTTSLSVSNGAQLNLSSAGSVSLAALTSDGQGGAIFGNLTLNGPFSVDVADATTLSPLVIQGDLTLAGATVDILRYGKLDRKTTAYDVLSVTGDVTSDFTNDPNLSRWKWIRTDNTWRMLKPGFVILFK